VRDIIALQDGLLSA